MAKKYIFNQCLILILTILMEAFFKRCAEHQVDHDRAAHHRQGHVPKPLPEVCAVHLGGLVITLVDGGQARHEDGHDVADAAPGVHHVDGFPDHV